MNQLKKISALCDKPSRLIIGLMSGTSCDGLDIGLYRFAGFGKNTQYELLAFSTTEFDENLRDDILDILGATEANLLKLTVLNERFAMFTASAILTFLKQQRYEPEAIDCIASHGQTIFHAPKSLHKKDTWPNATLQIGDGDHIAKLTGILTISDFRQGHIASGGEGAPLAPYADYALFSSEVDDRVLLNIGGISNFTFLPRASSAFKPMASDSGPGNTLLNALSRKYFDLAYDKDGMISRKGKVDELALASMLKSDFFIADLPKSTGQEYFNLEWFMSHFYNAQALRTEDLFATANALTVKSIVHTLLSIGLEKAKIYVSGGGFYNTFMMETLALELPKCEINNFEDLGISAEAKESLVFAFLANENFASTNLEYPWHPSKLVMGKFSLPH